MVNYFNEAPCIYFSLADDGTILEANPLLCKTLEYEWSELAGQKCDLIFTIPTRIFQQTHFFPLLKMQGHAEEIFITLRKKSGEYLPVLINAQRNLVAERAVNIYVGIVVYNRQKFEEELIAARNAAQKALHENTMLMQAKEELQRHAEALDEQIYTVNKQNRELQQFNQVVTHNIQEPLRKLSVFLGLLLDENNIQKQEALVGKVKGAMTQMSSIVSGLQQYIWLNESPLSAAPIEIDQMLALVKNKLLTEHEGVELQLESSGPAWFEGDVTQIEMLFYQLLYNSIRFRKEAGKAFVRVTTNVMRQNRFRHIEGRYMYVDYIRIQVQDWGIGFNDQFKDQAFVLFKRLHKESGRGVGLALCKKIVDNHHGDITIDSKLGEGTVVSIQFPLHLALHTLPGNGEVEANAHS